MKIVKGKYNEAKIFTDIVDDGALEQVKEMCDTDFLEGTKIRMMPDLHKGKGCTIGTTIKLKDKVVPNHVGLDIGCGLVVLELEESELDYRKLEELIRGKVPTGRENYTEARYAYKHKTRDFEMENYLSQERMDKGMGTLGGGNHFIEVSRNIKGRLVLTIHTGSRYLGSAVASHYQKIANVRHKESSFEKVIEELKNKGRHKDIQEELNKLKIENMKYKGIDLYLEGKEKDDYMNDLHLAQVYAKQNRESIANTIIDGLGLKVVSVFDTVHNYIDVENNILRKGAVSAKKGEKLIIPINMRDGSIIAEGLGNDDWNQSAPHGAGRIYSRTKAKEKLDMDEFKEMMEGIWTESVVEETLDEAPGAYKSLEDIQNNITDTVNIKEVIKPVYNYKAKDVPVYWGKNKK